MGSTAEEVASRYSVSRADQDAFAAESQRRAEAAIAAGRFRDEIVPVEVKQRKGTPAAFTTDEHPRGGTTVEKLGSLKPAFKSGGSVTAGNASGINDGASALVVASEKWARAHGKQPLVRVVSYASMGVAPAIMGDDSVTFVQEEDHLRVPVVRAQRPAVMEDDRLGVLGTPILVEDVRAVGRGDEGHVCHPLPVVPASGVGAGGVAVPGAGAAGAAIFLPIRISLIIFTPLPLL
jgi:hypothetical protein